MDEKEKNNKNKLQLFENPEFGKVRALSIDGEPWLVGKDVADILGYSNSSKAVSVHVDEEDMRKEMLVADSRNGNVVTQTTVINESGLYSLILSSKLPAAKKIKRWVTSEILPSIRKTGSYFSSKPMSRLDILSESIKALQEQERRMANIEMDMEDMRESQRIANSRIDTLDCVCPEGTKRQKLTSMINAYALKCGLRHDKAWKDFKDAYNTAYHTNLSLLRTRYAEKHGLKKKPSTPEYLELTGLLDDGLRIADKLLNSQKVTN